jgi:hypothetical protein
VPVSLKRVSALAVTAAALAAAGPYVVVIRDYFIQDDFGVVALLSGKPALYFPRWFVSTWMDGIWGYTPDEIRPFPAVTYQLASLWGAASPVANHAINIAFHMVNTLLVLRIARAAAGLAPYAAFAAALVFAWLPMQAESVAWVTGRVDSMPACFYMASFLLFVRWRADGSPACYVGSVVCCFLALFSKQNAVTLAPALVLYDVIVRGPRPARALLQRGPGWALAGWKWLRPYVPYAILTVAYLALRYVLFGEVAREGMMTGERIRVSLLDLSMHLKRMAFGEPGVAMSGVRALLITGGALAAVIALAARYRGRDSARLARVAVYFLLVWIALGAAPTLVAGYASPRHMYLASAGWAIALAIGLEALWQAGRRWLRSAAIVAVAAVLAAYAVQLRAVVRDWNTRAAVSQRAVADVEREALASPAGSLIIAGVPRASWEFALPHALRPPFTQVDLTSRVSVISRSSLYCCPAIQWEEYTRRTLRAWLERDDRPPVIALYWDPRSGTVSRLSDRDEPYLRPLMAVLADTGDRAALDEAILDTLAQLVARHGAAIR